MILKKILQTTDNFIILRLESLIIIIKIQIYGNNS